MHQATGSWRAHSELAETTERRQWIHAQASGAHRSGSCSLVLHEHKAFANFLLCVLCRAALTLAVWFIYLSSGKRCLAKHRQQPGLMHRQKMFLFVPLRRGEKSRGSFAMVASLRPVRDDTEAQRYVMFWPSLVFCYLVFDIGRKLTLWNRMQRVSSQQEPKTLAISGRW